MKKISLLLAALALVLGTSQCSKENEPMKDGGRQHIVLNASFDDGNSKIADDNNGGLKWSVDDQIDVFQNNAKIGFLKCTDADNGVFSGDIDLTTDDLTFTYGKEIGDGYYMEQSGELGDVIYLTASAPYNAKGDYDVTMTMPHAVLKLDLSGFAGSGNVTISDGTNTASVAGVTAASTAVYVAVPADGSEKTYTFSGSDWGALKIWTLNPNTFYTKEGDPAGEAIKIEKYVDLGLPSGLKWATCNLGATYGTTDASWYGDYYAWGETEPYYSSQDPLTWKDGKSGGYCWQSYCGNSGFVEWSPAPYDGNEILTSGYDAAAANWGDGWRMPTQAEWQELCAKTESTWTTLNGVNGRLFRGTTEGYTDVALFLPAVGYRSGTSLLDAGSRGDYWSSSLYSGNPQHAYLMSFGSDDVGPQCYHYRYAGFAVRPVR